MAPSAARNRRNTSGKNAVPKTTTMPARLSTSLRNDGKNDGKPKSPILSS